MAPGVSSFKVTKLAGYEYIYTVDLEQAFYSAFICNAFNL